VVVAPPDHWHAIPAIRPARPARTSTWRSPSGTTSARPPHRRRREAERADRVIGTQQRSAPHFIEAVRRIKAGEIGKVTMVHAWNAWKTTDMGGDLGSPPTPRLRRRRLRHLARPAACALQHRPLPLQLLLPLGLLGWHGQRVGVHLFDVVAWHGRRRQLRLHGRREVLLQGHPRHAGHRRRHFDCPGYTMSTPCGTRAASPSTTAWTTASTSTATRHAAREPRGFHVIGEAGGPPASSARAAPTSSTR